MQIVVQEGEVLVSLTTPIQAIDDGLRTTTTQTVAGQAKVYYRDHEMIMVEARDGNLQILPGAIGAVSWVSKGRCYQLKIGG